MAIWLFPAHVLCAPYDQEPVYSIISYKATYVGCMCVKLQLLPARFATAVTLWWKGCRNKSQHRKLTLKKIKIISRRSCRDSNSRRFNHESDALPLSYPGSFSGHRKSLPLSIVLSGQTGLPMDTESPWY